MLFARCAARSHRNSTHGRDCHETCSQLPSCAVIVHALLTLVGGRGRCATGKTASQRQQRGWAAPRAPAGAASTGGSSSGAGARPEGGWPQGRAAAAQRAGCGAGHDPCSAGIKSSTPGAGGRWGVARSICHSMNHLSSAKGIWAGLIIGCCEHSPAPPSSQPCRHARVCLAVSHLLVPHRAYKRHG
jgi:hypothetical protein